MKKEKLSGNKTNQREKMFPLFLNSQTAAFLIILSTFALESCKQSNDQSSQTQEGKAPLVKIQAAQKTKMVSYIEITGTVQANVFTEVKSPADGIIESLFVRENQHTKKGEIIAVINPDDRMALTADNQLKINQLEKQIASTETGSDKYNNLVKELQEAKEDLEYAQNMYQTVPVICPMSGLVTYRWLDQGSQVFVKDKIITVTDMSSLVIKSTVNEKYFAAVKAGYKLPVILNAYSNDTLTGEIRLVYPQIDPETRSVKFDIRLLNFNKKILPGMMASIKIPVSVKEDAVSIPNHAVLTSPDNKYFLFVVDKDSIAYRRIIQTGITYGHNLEITKGLNENERVVVSGQEMLKDRMKVNITGK